MCQRQLEQQACSCQIFEMRFACGLPAQMATRSKTKAKTEGKEAKAESKAPNGAATAAKSESKKQGNKKHGRDEETKVGAVRCWLWSVSRR